MSNIAYENDLFEAIEAADVALEKLYETKKFLSSAKNWGIYDMVGGGLIATAVKRKKMSNAQNSMNEAKDALKRFEVELDDVDEVAELNFNMDDFVSFSDYFFDNFFSDYIVQSRINDAKSKIEWIISVVEKIKEELIEELNS